MDIINFRFNQCFGVFGILDYLHGTDDLFRSGRSYSRHVILLGLTPARQLYPDPPKVKDLPSDSTSFKSAKFNGGQIKHAPEMSRRALH
jgi:hypothetical protein